MSRLGVTQESTPFNPVVQVGNYEVNEGTMIYYACCRTNHTLSM